MKKILYALFLLLPFAGHAQPEFDQRLNFDQIKAMLTEGIDQKDLRKQALAWYHWAYYDEEQTGLSDSAFQYLARSADRFGKSGDSLAYHRTRADLADRMAARGLRDEAIKIQQEALSFAERTNNLYLKTHLLARLSRIYSDKGDAQKSTTLRRLFTKENQALKDTVLDIIVAKYEVEHNGLLGKYAIARYEASNALRLAEQIKRPDFITWGQYSVGKYSILDRDYNMALFFLKKAEKSAPRTNVALRRDICRQLSMAYASLDSLELALYYANRTTEIGDTLIAEEREAALHRVALQFDTREKRKEIAQLEKEKSAVEEQSKQQRIGLFTMAVAIAALTLSFFVVVRDYKHRIRMDKIVADQQQEIDQQKIRDLENNLKIETMQSMLAGQESERQRVAQDLHDSVGGLLAAVKMQMETMNAKEPALSRDEDWLKIRKLLDETVSETRHIARNMQPSALLEFGLVTALRDLTTRVHGKGMPQLTFQHFGDFSDLDRDLALNCYRIIQELVQNSLKHAQAKEILVQITRTEDEIALHVEDDGKGFDPKTTQKGMGTDNLARRAQFLKAELSVQSAIGQGTSTVVTVPLGKTQGKP
ncbi:MAG TPA: sensor histidine kinase [Saprospiraceae bacterium]|nr:sensor histidine kinase [Saprospiraceae bacterium]